MTGIAVPVSVLRVMTLNAWFRPPLEDRTLEMIAWIDRVQPHVVCLQEVRSVAGEATLADQLGERCIGEWSTAFEGRPDEDGLLSGNAIVSRWPIKASESCQLECVDVRPKLLMRVSTGGFNVFCVHLTSDPAGAAVRERQVLVVDDWIRSRSESSGLPPILAGDFNAPPGASAIRFLRGESSLKGRSTFYQDSWAVAGEGSGITWDHRNPHVPPAYLFNARIDYIFVGVPTVPLGWSGGLNPDVDPVGQVVAAYLVCNSTITGTYASDHYGVVADIRWPRLTLA